MYAHFLGKIEEILSDKVILEVNNIGYEIYMPESILSTLEINSNLKIYTYLHVREDDMKLFGFTKKEELNFFKKIINVSGVGPKMAIGIISNIKVEDMCVAIATDNITLLKSIPGVGNKLAQKIILELKDKVLKDQMNEIKEIGRESKLKSNDKELQEAISALVALGFLKRNIEEVIVKYNLQEGTVEEIIKNVLKYMQK